MRQFPDERKAANFGFAPPKLSQFICFSCVVTKNSVKKLNTNRFHSIFLNEQLNILANLNLLGYSHLVETIFDLMISFNNFHKLCDHLFSRSN